MLTKILHKSIYRRAFGLYPYFNKRRSLHYKFASIILNLLSSTFKDSRYPKNKKIDWESIRQIGIVCQWGIGDAVLMIPLIKMLRKVSKAKIVMIGKPWLKELFMYRDMCDYVHICVPPWTSSKGKYLFWKSDWRKYFSQLKSLRTTHFDLLISIRYDPREIFQLRFIHSKIRAAYSASGGRQWLDIDFGVNPSIAKRKHVVYDATLSAEILTKQKTHPNILIDASSHQISRSVDWLRENGYNGGIVLAVSPSAGNSTRCWYENSYNKVLKDLPKAVGFIMVILPPDEKDSVNLQWPSSIPGSFWKGSLSELQGMLSLTDLLLTVDSGVMHLGAGCGCHIIAIFGPTQHQWFRPFTAKSEIIMVEPMPCRPCFDKCIRNNPICMENLEENDVKKAVIRKIAQIAKPRAESYLKS